VPAYGLTSLTNGAAGDLLVTNGTSEASGNLYEVTGGPTGPPTATVTSVTPSTGSTNGLHTETIHGNFLTGATTVTFGGVAATTVVVSTAGTKITAKDPAGSAGAVAVTVSGGTYGTGSKVSAFTYVAPTATHTTLSVLDPTGPYKGKPITLKVTVSTTPAHALHGTVKFLTTDPTTLATRPLGTGNTVSFTTTFSTAGAHKFSAVFTPSGATATTYASSTSSTVTFPVSTVPANGGTVKQTFQETVIAGRLTLSCTRYATVETPPRLTSTTTLGAAIKTCPLVTFPAVHLNGLQQTRSEPMNPIYIFTARGAATSGWSLSAAMVATAPTSRAHSTTPATTYVPGLGTIRPDCASAADFCDNTLTLGGTVHHGQIPASDLTFKTFTCTPSATTHNTAAPTVGTGGTFASPLTLCTAPAGTSGGRFLLHGGTFKLTIPNTVRHGTYFGTVEYTLASII
jgi:hypothetical protein